MDWNPLGSSVHGIFPDKITAVIFPSPEQQIVNNLNVYQQKPLVN